MATGVGETRNFNTAPKWCIQTRAKYGENKQAKI